MKRDSHVFDLSLLKRIYVALFVYVDCFVQIKFEFRSKQTTIVVFGHKLCLKRNYGRSAKLAKIFKASDAGLFLLILFRRYYMI